MNRNENMQQPQLCKKCVIPNTSELIPFNKDGICRLCELDNSNGKENGKKVFDEKDLLDSIEKIRKKGEGKKYDCIVGASGGRDSTYLIYLLTQKHHLRCLCVYYRTPFTSDTIDKNVRRIVKELGADFEEINLSQEYHRRIASKMVKLWEKAKNRTIVNFACAPCKFINREMYGIASKHGIPTIIYGTNIYEAVQIAPGISKNNPLIREGSHFYSAQRKILNSINLLFIGAKLLFRCPQLLRYLSLGIKSSVMYISPHTGYLALRYPGIKTFDYFYGGQWNESDLEAALEKVKWERPHGCNSSWKADCCFAELKNMLFKETIGITYADAFFSNMIRAGLIDRQEALERLRTECKVSDVRLKEVKDILARP